MKELNYLEALDSVSDDIICETAPSVPKKRRDILPAIIAAAALVLGIFAAMHAASAPQKTAEGNTPPTVSDAPPAASEGKPTAAPTRKPSKTTEESSGQLDPTYTFEDCIDDSHVIFTGECLSKTVKDGTGEADMEFRVTRVFRGEIAEGDVILVRANDPGRFGEGAEYLLLTRPTASAYEGINRFYFANFAIKRGAVYDYGIVNALGQSFDQLLERTEDYISSHGDPWDGLVFGDYCDSEDIAKVCEFSDCIVKVRAESIHLKAADDRTSYICTVLSVLKGDAEGDIEVIAFDQGIELRGEYLLLLSSSESGYYTMSSPISIIPADSPQAAEVQALFE